MKYRSYYICHHCTNYFTINKTDITKHLNATRLCKKNNQYLFDEAYNLSLNHKFYFPLNEKIDKTKLNEYIQNYDKNNEIEQNVKNNKDLDLSYDEIKDKYVCVNCNNEFVSKQLLKHHLSENKCVKVNKINHEINENQNIHKKVIFENIEKKCITYHISFHQLEQILDNYISQNHN